MDDVWNIARVPPIKQLFPTQKPEALLERIITAASNPGDIVLDPFCGCGTAIVESQRLGRRWYGIDITHLATNLIKTRLLDLFDPLSYDVIGEPTTLDGPHSWPKKIRTSSSGGRLGSSARARPSRTRAQTRGSTGACTSTTQGRADQADPVLRQGRQTAAVARPRPARGDRARESRDRGARRDERTHGEDAR
jgi:DNA methylase